MGDAEAARDLDRMSDQLQMREDGARGTDHTGHVSMVHLSVEYMN